MTAVTCIVPSVPTSLKHIGAVICVVVVVSMPAMSFAGTSANPADIGEMRLQLVDASRGTRARGTIPATQTRKLPTTVLLPAHRNKSPLLVFAIGYNNSAAGYREFLLDFARIGYVVAVPEFPLATNTLPGRPLQADVPNQPQDISFVISEMLRASAKPGALHGAIDPRRIAVIGQSDGAITASAVALNSCCIDRRVGAVVSIAGDKSFMADTWVATGTRPWLGIHGTSDHVASFSGSKELYRTAGRPRFVVLIDRAEHLDPTNNDALRPQVVALIRLYLRRFLFGNTRAGLQFDSLANNGRFHLTSDGPTRR